MFIPGLISLGRECITVNILAKQIVVKGEGRRGMSLHILRGMNEYGDRDEKKYLLRRMLLNASIFPFLFGCYVTKTSEV